MEGTKESIKVKINYIIFCHFIGYDKGITSKSQLHMIIARKAVNVRRGCAKPDNSKQKRIKTSRLNSII